MNPQVEKKRPVMAEGKKQPGQGGRIKGRHLSHGENRVAEKQPLHEIGEVPPSEHSQKPGAKGNKEAVRIGIICAGKCFADGKRDKTGNPDQPEKQKGSRKKARTMCSGNTSNLRAFLRKHTPHRITSLERKACCNPLRVGQQVSRRHPDTNYDDSPQRRANVAVRWICHPQA